MKTENDEHPPEHHHDKIHVKISYVAAVKPYEVKDRPDVTIGHLKTTALEAFGVKETESKKFKLFHGKIELTDPHEPLHKVAGHHKELHLKLEEVIIHG